MKSGLFRLILLSFLASQFFYTSLNAQITSNPATVIDGKVGPNKIILVSETGNSDRVKGFFVVNRGKAVEEKHPFSIDYSRNKPFFQSDLYVGPIKTTVVDSMEMKGKLKLVNRKKKFLFFYQKADFEMNSRPAIAAKSGHRYQQEIFDTIEVKSDVLYAKAPGYWTRSPYSSDPYVVTLGKGLIKTFKEPEMLDLKLDFYFSRADVQKIRPVVMLIHGGAFYIGNKESACEQALATALAKRGYFVASIDYRLGFKPVPADIELGAYRAIQDAHAALRFLSFHSKGLQIDPNHIYVGGTSAGAVASLNVAFMDNDERPERILEMEKKGQISKIEESGNKLKDTFSIKAVANMWGAVSNVNIIDADEKIPVLSIHGTADDIVPYDYDYPFKNSLMINRLIMDKMYGSKPIHDRLNSFGFKNKLVTLPGLGHEPELKPDNSLNNYIDTLIQHITTFFYEQTAPQVFLPATQLMVNPNSSLKPFYYEVRNGNVVEISAEGGLKASPDPADASVIWFDRVENRKLKIRSTNQYDAWNTNEFPVTVVR